MLTAAMKDGHQHWLVLFAVLCAAISAYYYFKIIQAIYFRDSNEAVVNESGITPTFRYLLVFTAVLIIVLGLFPYILTDWLHYYIP